jgi:hypothetical protein
MYFFLAPPLVLLFGMAFYWVSDARAWSWAQLEDLAVVVIIGLALLVFR